MLYTLALGILVLYLCDRLHRRTIDNKVLAHRYLLFEVRDHLREAVIKGDVRAEHWVFKYLDSSIGRTIGKLGHLSLWQALAIVLANRNDQRIATASRCLEQELLKPENQILARVHAMYMGVVALYLLDRHVVLKLLLTLMVIRQRVEHRWRRTLNFQTHAPETSTLGEFAPAA